MRSFFDEIFPDFETMLPSIKLTVGKPQMSSKVCSHSGMSQYSNRVLGSVFNRMKKIFFSKTNIKSLKKFSFISCSTKAHGDHFQDFDSNCAESHLKILVCGETCYPISDQCCKIKSGGFIV